jgi:hypothetical protein
MRAISHWSAFAFVGAHAEQFGRVTQWHRLAFGGAAEPGEHRRAHNG